MDLHQNHEVGSDPAVRVAWRQRLPTCVSFPKQRYSLLIASDGPLAQTIHIGSIGPDFDFKRKVRALDFQTQQISRASQERERERQRARSKDRQRERERQTETERDRQRQRETDRETERQRGKREAHLIFSL
jgi:hypothetical protein